MSKKKKHEEHENHERWLVSYADFITLLFAFFVVMYSVSRVDNKRMDQAVKSIQWAMHFGGTGGVGQLPIFQGPPSLGGDVVDMGGGPLSPPLRTNVVESIRTKIENRLRVFLVQRSGPAMVTITVDGDRVLMRLAASDFFDSGQALIRPQALPVLDAIAEEIVPMARPVRIEGHTDDSPVAGNKYRDNWELSAVRAATVASYLERAHHMSPERLSATGFAATRPLSQEVTPQAKELNRRIEMVLELELKAKPGRPDGPKDLAPPRPVDGGKAAAAPSKPDEPSGPASEAPADGLAHAPRSALPGAGAASGGSTPGAPAAAIPPGAAPADPAGTERPPAERPLPAAPPAQARPSPEPPAARSGR